SLRGKLIDDAGAAIPNAVISVLAFAPDDGRTPVRLTSLSPCEGAPHRGLRAPSPEENLIETDDRGEFCDNGKAPLPKITLKLRFAGSKLHDPFETKVTVDSEKDHSLHTVLRFEPPPEVIDLDRESVTVSASLRVDRNDVGRLDGGTTR